MIRWDHIMAATLTLVMAALLAAWPIYEVAKCFYLFEALTVATIKSAESHERMANAMDRKSPRRLGDAAAAGIKPVPVPDPVPDPCAEEDRYERARTL